MEQRFAPALSNRIPTQSAMSGDGCGINLGTVCYFPRAAPDPTVHAF